LEHPAGLRSMRSRADAEVHVGLRQLESVKESARHLVVVVLPSVHQDFLVALAQFPAHSGNLDELRPRPDDGYDFHSASASLTVSTVVVAGMSAASGAPDSDITAGRPMLM